MNCWICGDPATTAEHRTKASDLRAMFGPVDQNKPLYFHTEERRNQAIKGMRASILRSRALLCAKCNNERTQPYDRAWERLSEFLRSRRDLRSRQVLQLSNVFPGSVKRSMLHVHLFFVKLFGCAIVEHSIPIPIQPFADALMQSRPHANVFVRFVPVLPDRRGRIFAGVSNFDTITVDGVVSFATWFYYLDKIAANVLFAVPRERRRRGVIEAWHPLTVGKHLRIGSL
jgi:hypothetical protein